jgi:hypothetical protein
MNNANLHLSIGLFALMLIVVSASYPVFWAWLYWLTIGKPVMWVTNSRFVSGFVFGLKSLRGQYAWYDVPYLLCMYAQGFFGINRKRK